MSTGHLQHHPLLSIDTPVAAVKLPFIFDVGNQAVLGIQDLKLQANLLT